MLIHLDLISQLIFLGYPGDRIIDELANYRDRLGKYSLPNLWNVAQRCSPIYWWTKYVGVAPLAQTAAIIAAAPATNASVERSFKQLKKVYSLERCRLSFTKAEVNYNKIYLMIV